MNPPLFDFHPGLSPLLISFPHSGTHLPDELRPRLRPSALRVPDTDWHVPLLYSCWRELGASVLIANYSRYLVDLNRPPDGTPLYPGQAETSLCPTRSFSDEPLYLDGQTPPPQEIQQRLSDYWLPYHQKLIQTIDDIRTEHGHCILWDAHSIRAQVPLFFDGRLPDLNLGTADGRSCGRARAARLAHALGAQARFSVALNGRFKGGYITRHYGDPPRGVDAIQLEVAQAAYMNEDQPEGYDPARAADLQTLLRSLLQAVIKL